MNTGLHLTREKDEQRGDEYQFGAFSPACAFLIPEDDRDVYLPKGELQFGVDDFMDCATRGPINLLETKLTYAFRRGLITGQNRVFLIANNYVVWRNNVAYIELSDRFNAILSNTTRQGNSLKAPIHSIHEYGVIPKAMLPRESWMSFAQYHDSSKITRAMLTLAAEFKARFPIYYDQVYDHETGVASDIVIDAGYAWPPPINGIYGRTEAQPNHVFITYARRYKAFDNYEESPDDFRKDLAENYKFYDYGYRIYILPQSDYARLVGLYQQLVTALKQILTLRKLQLGRMFGNRL